MALPIIFLHQGNSPYLWFSIRQAKFFNPESEIILLGDSSNQHLPFVRHYCINEYFEQAKIFASSYKHMSTNSYQFELLCFQRWFILLEFLQKNKINQCVQLDTDLMVYCDLSQIQECFAHASMTLVKGHGPQTSYINSVDGLARICQFLLESYQNPHAFNRLKNWYERYSSTHKVGGVCDMIVLNFYKQDHPSEISSMENDIGFFDDNFARPEGFLFQNGKKTLFWQQNLPYVKAIETQGMVRLFTMHFQGHSKRFIPWYASQKDVSWFLHLPGFFTKYSAGLGYKAVKRLLRKWMPVKTIG
ncbi:MAG: hypothetical protein K0Q57_269 [Gammaproteobacteria bacterium]|jgi:hypothetical protein|nr:hypothetical protein [Gammaproteobacteria bacterium]